MQTTTGETAPQSAAVLVASSKGTGQTATNLRRGRKRGARDLRPRRRRIDRTGANTAGDPRILKVRIADMVYYWLDTGTGAEARFLDACKSMQDRMAAIEQVLDNEHRLKLAQVSGWTVPAGVELVMREVSHGCWVTHRGDLCVQEYENGTWVRVPGRSTGRGPHGDAIRYEPSLSLGLAWAMQYLAERKERV